MLRSDLEGNPRNTHFPPLLGGFLSFCLSSVPVFDATFTFPGERSRISIFHDWSQNTDKLTPFFFPRATY
jgi:hypothetical protein